MTLDDLRKTKVGQDPRNAAIFSGGPLESSERERSQAAALGGHSQAKQVGQVRVVVRIVEFTKRKRDDDNVQSGYKPLRDAIAESLGIDDGDERIEFRVHSCRC